MENQQKNRPKIDQPSTKHLPNTFPKSSKKTSQNQHKKVPRDALDGSWRQTGYCACFFPSDLAASWAPPRASGDHLGVVLGHLGASWSRPGTDLGPSLGRLGASWSILGTSWEPLGASWKRFGTNPKNTLMFNPFFAPNFEPRNLKNQAPAAGRARFSEKRFWK